MVLGSRKVFGQEEEEGKEGQKEEEVTLVNLT